MADSGVPNDGTTISLNAEHILAGHVRAGLESQGVPDAIVRHIIDRQRPGLVDEIATMVRRRTEAMQGLVVRRSEPDPDRDPIELLKYGRESDINMNVAREMPRSPPGSRETVFVDIRIPDGECLGNAELEQRLAFLGFAPEYPERLAEINAADPTFLRECRNATVWRSGILPKKGLQLWGIAAFDSDDQGAQVFVRSCPGGWEGRWRFAGRLE